MRLILPLQQYRHNSAHVTCFSEIYSGVQSLSLPLQATHSFKFLKGILNDTFKLKHFKLYSEVQIGYFIIDIYKAKLRFLPLHLYLKISKEAGL